MATITSRLRGAEVKRSRAEQHGRLQSFAPVSSNPLDGYCLTIEVDEPNGRERVYQINLTRREMRLLKIATVQPLVTCPACDGDGEGEIEHPFLQSSYGGSHAECPPDPSIVDCEDCNGSGEIARDTRS